MHLTNAYGTKKHTTNPPDTISQSVVFLISLNDPEAIKTKINQANEPSPPKKMDSLRIPSPSPFIDDPFTIIAQSSCTNCSGVSTFVLKRLFILLDGPSPTSCLSEVTKPSNPEQRAST